MQFSVREAKAHFAHATTAAANGEKVVITKHGKPFVELVPATPTPEGRFKGDLWERLDQAQKALGLRAEDYPWPDEFNDPEFTKLAMGLDD